MSLLLATSGDIASGVVEAEGIDMDGVSDYLSRSTDLVGNVDSKTFTFSCWIYITNASVNQQLYSWASGGLKGQIYTDDGGNFTIDMRSSTGNQVFTSTISTANKFNNTWISLQISADMTNTAKRHIYINDVLVTPSWLNYINTNIQFSGITAITVGKHSAASLAYFKGRLSNLFLDYTYRDLSIEANRRLFITAYGKPADGLASLNPILYLPMKDAATAHINLGTGGNFVQNGTLDTASRGANQQNCTQLSLDGTADYLSRSGLSGTSSKELLISVNTKAKESETLSIISTRPITLQHIPASSKFSLKAYNSSNVLILSVDIPIYSTSLNIEYSLQCSVDLTNTSNRKVQLNGVDITASCTWTTYTNDNIEYSYVGTISIGLATDYQEIGELYLGNSYLSNISSFWDSVENKPIPVRKVIADTGVTPLIAMPLDASNAGKNYGTGGDFTANSAPYVGARGASEFWARSIYSAASSTNKLTNSTINLPQSKTYSGLICMQLGTSAGNTYVATIKNDILSSVGGSYFYVSSTGVGVGIKTTDGAAGLSAPATLVNKGWEYLLFSIDLNNPTQTILCASSKGVSIRSRPDLAAHIGIAASSCVVGSYLGSGDNGGYGVASFYFTTDYIDFSQEVNRLKFLDGLGYPLDLAKQIDAGVIPKPLIYLPFNDPSNLGLNLGTGGNFTVNGTVTQGADVNG